MTFANLQAIVFDLDGTLADTAPDIRESLVRALASEGLPPVDLANVRVMVGNGHRVLVTRALDQLSVPPDETLITHLSDAFHAEYVLQQTRLSRLYEGVVEGLQRIRSAGLRLGLCSNKSNDLCHMIVDNLDLARHFDVVLGAGTGIPRKPDPAPLLHVIEKLGATPDTALYVGDSETDVKTARAAGVPVVLVSYGYTLRHANQLGADNVVDSVLELASPGRLARSA